MSSAETQKPKDLNKLVLAYGKAKRELHERMGPLIDRWKRQARERRAAERAELKKLRQLAEGRGLTDPVMLADDAVAGVLHRRAWSIARTLRQAGYAVVKIGPHLYAERANIAAIFRKCRKHLHDPS